MPHGPSRHYFCLSVCFWFSSRLFSVLRYPSQSGWLLERDSLHTFVSFALIDIVSSPRFSVCTVHTNRAAHHRLSTPSIHPPNHLSRCVVPHLPLWLWLRCPVLSLRPPSCRYPKIDLLSWQVRIARYMHQRFQLSCQHMFIPQYSFPVVLFCPSHLPVCVELRDRVYLELQSFTVERPRSAHGGQLTFSDGKSV